jgi:hypothetical protein
MTTTERIQAAKEKTKRVVDHLLYLLALHANNDIIVYSDTLSSQIRYLHAANAFEVFRTGLHQFEIVRLCALWDRVGDDKESIPTIVALIDRPEVIEALAHESRAQWTGHDEGFGQERAQKARDELGKAIANARAILRSPKLLSIMNLRHKHLAHSLTETTPIPVRTVKLFGEHVLPQL